MPGIFIKVPLPAACVASVLLCGASVAPGAAAAGGGGGGGGTAGKGPQKGKMPGGKPGNMPGAIKEETQQRLFINPGRVFKCLFYRGNIINIV